MRTPLVHHATRRRRALRRRALWTGGELLVTVGVVLMLLVVHQLWWTNREAHRGAGRKVQALEREWDRGMDGGAATGGSVSESDASGASDAGSGDQQGTRQQGKRQPQTTVVARPAPSQAYAVLVIPRLALRAPVAEGISKPGVLNKGYVGHYPGTAQAGQPGNFALAGHRNTHGEPFRYLNRLQIKDVVQVETAAAVYTYAVDRILPETSARDSGVIRPVPRSVVKPAYGYSEPGYYITLTTCTPEYTSRYRLVVWGKLLSMRPR